MKRSKFQGYLPHNDLDFYPFFLYFMRKEVNGNLVALQFKELAEETGNEKNREGDGYAHRQRFAKQYLEKLINIENNE